MKNTFRDCLICSLFLGLLVFASWHHDSTVAKAEDSTKQTTLCMFTPGESCLFSDMSGKRRDAKNDNQCEEYPFDASDFSAGFPKNRGYMFAWQSSFISTELPSIPPRAPPALCRISFPFHSAAGSFRVAS